MNRIINKALFYKEWINVRWVTLLTIVILLLYKGYGVISLLSQNNDWMKRFGTTGSNRWFNNGLYMQDSYFFIMILLVVILAMTLFIGEKTSETQGFIASMPFTRKEIILNKWIVGVLSIIISFTITYIFLSLFYAANISGLDKALNPYSDIVRWFFMNTLQYICIFTFMVLVQGVMGNTIVSGIVGGIMLIVAYFIAWSVQNLILRIYGFMESTRIVFDEIRYWLNIYRYNLTSTSAVNSQDIYNPFYYTNYESKLVVLFILTCLFLYLAYISYKKRDLEYNLRLIVFRNLEAIFIGIVAIFSGLLGGLIFGDYSLSVFYGCAFAFTIVGYFISRLLLKVLSSEK